MKQKILIIIGPTSSGKSDLAVALARKFNGEIVSADSRQVYRGLDIGTGKITKHEMRGIRHHLLDVTSPKQTYTAKEYLMDARRAIDDIARRGKLPIVVGGTGFYIDALVGRIILPDVPPDKEFRAQMEKKTALQLYALLKKRDPHRAKTIEPHNKRRLIRALEIAAAIGKSPKIQRKSAVYDALWLGISLPRQELDTKIAARLSARIQQGMIAEAKKLHRGGLSYKRMEALGLEYRALARFLQKKVSESEFKESVFRDIRDYAKRQVTYWKRNTQILWLEVSQKNKFSGIVRTWLGGR